CNVLCYSVFERKLVPDLIRDGYRLRVKKRVNAIRPWTGGRLMFIAMNRFRVARGSEAAFEQVWMSRDSHLDKVPGFVEFHLLRGPEAEDHTLFASHTIWESRAAFEA